MGSYIHKQEVDDFSVEWEGVCRNVLSGIKKLGHDIPLTGYESEDEMKEMTRRKRIARGKN